MRNRVCRLFEALNAQHDVHWLTGILGTWRVQYNCSSLTSPAVKKHTKMLTPTNAPEPPRTMLACCLLLSTAWNYPTAAGRLQLRARPQLMRAADEGDAPATTPATQVVRRDLGAYVGLTSIVALVPAVDWAGLGPETSNVARLLYFLGVKRQDLGESSPISSRSTSPLSWCGLALQMAGEEEEGRHPRRARQARASSFEENPARGWEPCMNVVSVCMYVCSNVPCT